MGLLALAGALSGAGQAGTQALSNMQTGFTQALLQNEREKFETARDLMHEEHATGRLDKTQTFEAGQNQQKMGADIMLHTGDRTAAAEQTDKKIAAEEDMQGYKAFQEKDLQKGKIRSEEGIQAEHQAVEREKLAELSAYHKGYLARVGSTRAEQLPPEKKAQLEVLNHEAEGHLKTAEKFHELAAKAEDPAVAKTYTAKAEAELRQLERVNQTREGLIKLDVPREVKGAGPAVKDRFAASPLGAGEAGAAETALQKPKAEAPRGILHTVERNRPVMPRGSAPKAQTDKIARGQLDYDIQEKEQELAHAKVHANKARVQYLQDQLDQLESRKATLTEGK